MELFQAEWCPHSHKVRQKLTELGLDFRARQVAVNPHERESLRQAAGTTEIPVLIVEGEEPRRGEEEILAYLGTFAERSDAILHRARAQEEVPTFEELKVIG